MSTDAGIPNGQEIAYWNDDAGSRWVTFQERIDRAFAPLSAVGLACAAPQAGMAVLDIGCGTGTTSLALADCVGAQGRVLGLDVSAPMLGLAKARGAGKANLDFVLADASIADLGGPYDLLFSRFGVMFFDDPVAALANVRCALRPEGRLVFVCWRELAANPWFHVPLEAVRPHVPPQPKVDPHAPGPLAFADPGRVERILREAGYGDVRIDPFDAALRLGDVSSATELLSQVGPTSRLLAGGDRPAQARAMDALSAELSRHESDGEVMLGAGVWTVVAHPRT